MSYSLLIILNLCILIPSTVGLLRFSKINHAYHPFIYCIWLGTIIELVSSLLALKGSSNAVISNIYVLMESALLTWQFERWKLFEKRKFLFLGILVLFIITWLLENVVISKITYFSSYFRIVYSFIIVIMSIIIINRLIVTERKSLLKNPIFLICVAFVFYYTLKIMVEAFWVYKISDKIFTMNVYNISVITNFIANLLFTVAIIWIPTRQKFTLPSS